MTKATKTYLTRHIATLAVLICSAMATAQSRQADQSAWVGAWATAVQSTTKDNMPPVATLSGCSARQIVRVTLSGETIRLKLSNAYGESAMDIASVGIADAADSCDIDTKSMRWLRFGGKKSVNIGAGEQAVSDPLKYKLKALSRVAITINYGKNIPQRLTSHPGSRTTTYIIKGEGSARTNYGMGTKTNHWYTLDALEVQSAAGSSIAIMGNSITDGRGSTTNQQNRWPDMMAVALHESGHVNTGVLNLGIGGNCVTQGGLGDTALDRFDRDILGQQGLSAVILFEGVNDIGTADGNSEAVAARLIEALKTLAGKSHAHGLKVYGATIMPFHGHSYYTPFHEAARTVVNEWIRESEELDGVIDFDAHMRDTAQPTRLRADLQDDWLHPNAAGHAAMGRLAADFLTNKK